MVSFYIKIYYLQFYGETMENRRIKKKLLIILTGNAAPRVDRLENIVIRTLDNLCSELPSGN